MTVWLIALIAIGAVVAILFAVWTLSCPVILQIPEVDANAPDKSLRNFCRIYWKDYFDGWRLQ